jgi:peptidoglycan hydrolase-like protein with peptidoglycan-binding domain
LSPISAVISTRATRSPRRSLRDRGRDGRLVPSRRGGALRPARLVAVALVAIVAALGSASPVAASSAQWPAQGTGDRGTDVLLIQHLLRARGATSLAATGYFGSATRTAVVSFQQRSGLVASGVVEATTWRKLIISLRYDRRGEAVTGLQVALNAKLGAGLPVTGWFGSMTRSAVISFQRGHGLAADGVVDAATWRTLVAHFRQPGFAASSVCPYPTGANGHRGHWGTSTTVASLEHAGRAMLAAGYGPAAIGDISLEHGGSMPGHVTHRNGLDADLRPMRRDRSQCSIGGTTWYRWENGVKVCCNPAYDRAATRALIAALKAAGGPRYQWILFNDPQLVKEKLTYHSAGHDDHLHVRFCQLRHADPGYRC